MTDRPKAPLNPGDPYVMHPSADPKYRRIPRLPSTPEHLEGPQVEIGKVVGVVIVSVIVLCFLVLLVALTVAAVRGVL